MKIFNRKSNAHLSSQGSLEHSNNKSHESIKFNFKRKKDIEKMLENKKKESDLRIDSR